MEIKRKILSPTKNLNNNLIKREILSPTENFINNFNDNENIFIKQENKNFCKTLEYLTMNKWSKKVLLSNPYYQSCENLSKKIQTKISILKVAFPFLTERQIRGKALNACGLSSIMGELPRLVFI